MSTVRGVLLASVLSLIAGAARADDADPDTSFSGDGVSFGTWPNGFIETSTLAVDASGAVFFGGTHRNTSSNKDFGVGKFRANGSLDTAFGSTGYRTVAFDYVSGGIDSLTGIFPQDDGKILLTGTAEVAEENTAAAPPAMTRLNASGALDITFGTLGKRHYPQTATPWTNPSLYVRGAARQRDGKMLLGGYCVNCVGTYSATVLRTDADGAIDTAFGFDGWASIAAPGQPRLDQLTLDVQNRPVLAGGTIDGPVRPLVVRFTTAGVADPSFGGGTGYVELLDLPNGSDGWTISAIATELDGSMYLAVRTWDVIPVQRTGIVRLFANGGRDYGFGNSGMVDLTLEDGSRIQALALRGDHTLVAAGWIDHTGGARDLLFARLAVGGAFDPGFDGNGKARISLGTNTEEAQAMTLSGERPVVVGTGVFPDHPDASAFVLRLQSDLIFSDGI